MKNIKSRTLLVFLASLILFNSSGFGLVEHSCSMRGKKSYSFVNKPLCSGCGKHNSSTNGKSSLSQTKCCDDKQAQKDVNLSESVVNITGKIIKSATEIFYKAVIWVGSFLLETVLYVIKSQSNDSSSLSGKNLLIFTFLRLWVLMFVS